MTQKCEVCGAYIEYPKTVPICEFCREKAKQKSYTVIIPVEGYYEWSGRAESEEDALEKGELEINSDYDPCFVIRQKGNPQISDIQVDGKYNYYRELVDEILKKYAKNNIKEV